MSKPKKRLDPGAAAKAAKAAKDKAVEAGKEFVHNAGRKAETAGMRYDRHVEADQTYQAGSAEANQALDNLQIEMSRIDDNYVKYVSASERKITKAQSKQERLSSMDIYSKMYNHELLTACVHPLEHGVNANSVAKAVSMMTTMCLLNSDFRASMSDKVTKAMMPVAERFSRDAPPGSPANKFYQSIVESQNGRMPVTPRSAAMMEIGFARRAFNDMREKGADQDKIMKQYNEACSVLRQRARADGVSDEMLNATKRTMIGKLMERDISYKQLYAETAYGAVEKAPGKPNAGPDAKPGDTVWRGEFQTADGRPYDGDFTVRMPMTAMEHKDAQTAAFYRKFSQYQSMDQIMDFEKSKDGLRTHALFEAMLVADTQNTEFPMDRNMAKGSVMSASIDAGVAWGKDHPEASADWVRRETEKQAEKESRQRPAGGPRPGGKSERPLPAIAEHIKDDEPQYQ